MIDYLRQSAWLTPEDLPPLTIIGCGAVGSNAGVLAARMGFKEFVLYDDDEVESHNLPNQAYFSSQIGKPKAEALASVIKSINPNTKITIINKRFDSLNDDLKDAVILAVDSISARKDILTSIRNNSHLVDLATEVRLGFDFGEISVLDPRNSALLKEWESALGDDASIAEGPCNRKICGTLVTLAASVAVHNLCNFYASRKEEIDWNFDPVVSLYLSDVLDILKKK